MNLPDAVVLLHGAWMNRLVMAYLTHALRIRGLAAHSLTYRTRTDTLEEHLDRLAARVASLDAPRVHLVGHSLGGLLVLRYLQRGHDERVHRAVLLGAPVTGCRAALALARWPSGRVLLGRSLALWREPVNASLGSGIEVGVIAGTRPLGLGRIVARLPKQNDGVVCVDETRFPAMRDHIALPVAHTEMLVSPAVARLTTTFLKTGAFRR
jgi:pimeloyl-ACP methyl ester carboxylesterase